jgi:hypothetical protein
LIFHHLHLKNKNLQKEIKRILEKEKGKEPFAFEVSADRSSI